MSSSSAISTVAVLPEPTMYIFGCGCCMGRGQALR